MVLQIEQICFGFSLLDPPAELDLSLFRTSGLRHCSNIATLVSVLRAKDSWTVRTEKLRGRTYNRASVCSVHEEADFVAQWLRAEESMFLQIFRPPIRTLAFLEALLFHLSVITNIWVSRDAILSQTIDLKIMWKFASSKRNEILHFPLPNSTDKQELLHRKSSKWILKLNIPTI